MENTRSIDLSVAERLKNDLAFRREWFRAALEVNVPDTFRDLREERKLTQTDLAERVEMKQAAVSRFENSGDANWKIETLLRLADGLDAQLIITLKKAEDVIAEIAREERDHLVVGASVINAASPRREANVAGTLAGQAAGVSIGMKTREEDGTAQYRSDRRNSIISGVTPGGRSTPDAADQQNRGALPI